MLTHPQTADGPTQFARLGKSCQNTQASFDDFPLKAWRAIWSLPGRVLFFLTSLRSFSSSPLGNLQTMFALPSLVASVVNKKNQKNFRRMLTHPPAADGPNLLSARWL
ncbi:hypothetical protein [uncultured Rikenella sp.]|uniref:hypothetical protein n=1 Tax=uncultured Rikenella sp. TaxID=368003 RepID=UPI0026383642|nr:hypothetical protein [uncultured Rikenella sp.]